MCDQYSAFMLGDGQTKTFMCPQDDMLHRLTDFLCLLFCLVSWLVS